MQSCKASQSLEAAQTIVVPQCKTSVAIGTADNDESFYRRHNESKSSSGLRRVSFAGIFFLHTVYMAVEFKVTGH